MIDKKFTLHIRITDKQIKYMKILLILLVVLQIPAVLVATSRQMMIKICGDDSWWGYNLDITNNGYCVSDYPNKNFFPWNFVNWYGDKLNYLYYLR